MNMSAECNVCKKVLTRQSTLNRHMREVHGKEPECSSRKSYVWTHRCLEQNCGNVFQTNKMLMDHLEQIHSVEFETLSLLVEDERDFLKWKSEIENMNNVSYILKRKNVNANGEIWYYSCNRSKTSFVPKKDEERSRRQRTQGSCKMDHSCTSQIKVIKENSRILVEWQKVHYGHTFDLQHIKLSKAKNQKVGTKRIGQVTSRRRLKPIFDNSDSSTSDDDEEARIIKLTKLSRELSECHKEAVKYYNNLYRVTTCDEYWKVTKEGDVSCIVLKHLDKNCCDEICIFCQVCNHMYSCDCAFYKEQKIMCKHIHVLIDQLTSGEFEGDSFANTTNTSALSTILQSTNKTSTTEKEIKSLVATLQNVNYKKFDDSILGQVHHHLQIINSLTTHSNLLKINDPDTKFMPINSLNDEPTCSRVETEEVGNVQENMGYSFQDEFICKSVLPVYDHDHQYC